MFTKVKQMGKGSKQFHCRGVASSLDSSAPSILPPQVRVPSTPSMLYSIYIVQILNLSFELECEKDENKQKEAGICPFFKQKTSFIVGF